jgi:hypothetical protein
VLNDVLDVQDPAQTLPPATRRQLRRVGRRRAIELTAGHPVAYLFLGTATGPFGDRLAREAVVAGLGAQTLARAGARTLSAACDVVPAVTSGAVPVGCAAPTEAGGALAGARSLVARSDTAGEAVSVWAPRTGPAGGWMRAEAAVLRSIGYAAQVVTVPDATYRALMALVPAPSASRPAQGGGASARPLVARRSVKATARPAAVAADGVLQGTLASDVRVPAAGAVTVALSPGVTLAQARRTHQVTYGEQALTLLMSSRMDESAAVVDPVEGLDFTSLRLR